MKKIIGILAMVGAVSILSGCGMVDNSSENNRQENQQPNQDQIQNDPENVERSGYVGDDRDEHGCIGSAGYQWCPSKEKCLRTWEEYCEEYKENYRGDNPGQPVPE